MTRQQISDRWGLAGKLMFIVAMCFCAEMLIYVIQMFVVLAIGRENYGSLGPVATAWRWLAWPPALTYMSAVLISLPLPRWRGRDTRWSVDGRLRVPSMGRGMLLLFGWLLLLSVWGHAASLLPEDAPVPISAVGVVYVMLSSIALLLLRIILGTLRLLPRSWRVLPPDDQPPVADTHPDVVIPDQRFAPKDGGR